jgi:hypothetical protein
MELPRRRAASMDDKDSCVINDLLYIVTAIALVLLMLACRRYATYKQRHPGGWLRYL